MFKLITPITYWILIVLWSFILYFYVKKMWGSKTQRLFSALVVILAIDAFRTLFESVYFGLWYTSLSGIIPQEIGTFLTRPELVIIPKLLNVIAAVVVIMLLLKQWLPKEEQEKERVTEALRESENRYFSLFAHNHSVMMLVDSVNGAIVDANPAACTYYGYSHDQLINMKVAEINTLTENEILREMAQAKSEKRNYFQFQHKLASGDVRDVEIYSGPISLHGKQLLYSIIHDITERKQAEKALLASEANLSQALKMEAVGTLAGGIAHDFNNILAAIIGYTEMARDDSQPDSTVAKDLDKVLEASNRAKDLVQQILSFSRQDETEIFPLQPVSIVKEAIKMLRPSLPTTIEINQNITLTTGLILADPTQIHQIVINLCTNAFHAMEEKGGRLDISLRETTLCTEDLVHKPNVKAGTFIQLSICDSGPGIAPEIKNKIFDPYFTTKETGKGTGMGLSIIHGIVKSYDGFISLYSELGEGTAFHVFLPVIKKESLPKTNVVERAPEGKERILFVDDEEILAEMGKDMLEKLGYRVTVKMSSVEALETFQSQPDQFDLVITDQTMPGMTGEDISRRMLQIRPDIPIILCTGYSSITSEDKAKSLGIKEFALKPLSKKDIAVLIRKALDIS